MGRLLLEGLLYGSETGVASARVNYLLLALVYKLQNLCK